MFRDLFRFYKKKSLNWKMTGRLMLLAVYGEEHVSDADYPIDKDLSKAYFAKRKFINVFKPLELLFTAVSMSLNKLIGQALRSFHLAKVLPMALNGWLLIFLYLFTN